MRVINHHNHHIIHNHHNDHYDDTRLRKRQMLDVRLSLPLRVQLEELREDDHAVLLPEHEHRI